MIIDTTLTKTELYIRKRDRWLEFIDKMDALIQRRRNERKEAIIEAMLQTDEGCKQLAAAMVEPRRCGGLEYE